MSFLVVLFVVRPVNAQSQRPITRDNLLNSLHYRRVTANEYIQLIRQHGVDFRLDPVGEEEIRRAGAYLGNHGLDLLIAAIRESYRITILIAKFQSLDGQTYGMNEIIISQLREATRNYHDLRIEPLDEGITADEGDELARIKGKERNAHFVIWGWFTTTRSNVLVNMHFVLVQWPRRSFLRQEQETLKLPLSDLETFNLQARISNDMVHLVRLSTGIIRLEMGDLDAAVERFTSVINSPTMLEEIIEPTRAYSSRAYAYLQKENYDLAIADYDKAIKLKPDESYFYFQRGFAYVLKADYVRAIDDFDNAIRLEPNDSDSYNNRAVVNYLKREYDLAIPDFNKAIKLMPDDPDAYYNRGLVYDAKHNYDLAITDFGKAIKLKPDYAKAYSARASANSSKGNYDLAIPDFDKAIKLEPDQGFLAYYGRALALYHKGNYDLAIADFDKVIKLKPEYAVAYYRRALALTEKGHYDLAIADFDKVIKLKPNDADAYFNRALAYHGKAKFDLAIADLDQVIKLKPDDADAYINRGAEYTMIGKYDFAIADLDQAIKLKPDDADAYFNRGLAYSHSGNPEGAISDFKKVLQVSKDDGQRQSAMTKIQELASKAAPLRP